MKFPAYWSKGTATETRPDGRQVSYSCWRWSDESQQDAQHSAVEAARRILRKWLSGAPLGRYGYGDRPLREEVLQQFTNERGELIAAVTQNAWGALVLNTAGAMFLDLDFPYVTAGEQAGHFFRRLLGKKSVSPDEKRQLDIQNRLADFVRRHAEWAFRLYRTHSGMRALATHDVFDPIAKETHALFATLGADPTYVRLCKSQASFRARLTPKPWRCGHDRNDTRWPRETEAEQQRFAKWQAGYVEAQSNFATCCYIETLGQAKIHPELAKIIEVHDQVTRASEPLELA